ncbi:MAG: 3',5'-cyclic-nucleotide phosphodiesterase [Synechococcus sp. SB0662_bin_45]|nr:3',5'-cyclic-nucleotide phosphodiesterase [Synechococcus sp. SB0668_bin_13]MYE20847.1 3',5'-cyclic-nucleotide phosphodiesterase [Synechococcus sp. SB0662_bin_45]
MAHPTAWTVAQLTDPHLLADPRGRYRGINSYAQFQSCLRSVRSADPDLILLTGDLGQDETWSAYGLLRDQLATCDSPALVMAGNHDQPHLLRSCLRRQASVAPCGVAVGNWLVIGLDSHVAGRMGGRLSTAQLDWLASILRTHPGPCLVALHHPPTIIGCPRMDPIALETPEHFLSLLQSFPQVKGVVFGHVHQAWRQQAPLHLMACPSTAMQKSPAQPSAYPDAPGWRLLRLEVDGQLHTQVMRVVNGHATPEESLCPGSPG